MSFEGQEHNLRHTSILNCLEIGGKDKPTVVRKVGLLLARPKFKILNVWLQKLQVLYVKSHTRKQLNRKKQKNSPNKIYTKIKLVSK